MNNLVPLPVVVPLVGAVTILFFNTVLTRRLVQAVTLSAALAEMALAAMLLHQAGRGTLVYWFGGWTPRHGVALGISFTVDQMGAGAALLAGLVVAAAVATTRWTIDDAHGIVHALMLTLLAAMAGFCLTGDLFNMFVFFELMAVSLFALMAFPTRSRASLRAALNFAITNSIGAFLVLIGIALLYGRTGALNLAEIGRQLSAGPFDRLTVLAFSLLTAGFLIKAAVVPFHFWLVDAAASAPLPVVMILAGSLDTLGVYGVARVYWTVFANPGADHRDAVRVVLIAIGAISALAGGILALMFTDARRRLGFVIVSHTGILLIGVGCLSVAGLAGAAVYAVGEGTVTVALFIGVALAGVGRSDEPRSVLAGAGPPRASAVIRSATGVGLSGRRAVVAADVVPGVGAPTSAAAPPEAGRLRAGPPRDDAQLPGSGASPAGRGAGLILLAVGGLATAGFPLFATGLGKAAIGDAADAAGFWWVTPIIILAAVLIGAAALDIAWSGSRRPVPAPRCGWVLPVTLGVGLLALSRMAVTIGRWATLAATRFVDTAGYSERVLGGVPAATPSAPADIGLSLHGVVADLFIAATAVALVGALNSRLSRIQLPSLSRVRATARHLHDGSIGDSVTWVTLGTATIALALATRLH